MVIQSAVGKPVNVMCFENGSDNLYPNPLIGSQCGSPVNIQSRWLEENQDGEKLLKGTIYTWAMSVLFTTPRRLSSKSLAVKVPMLKALPIKGTSERDVFPHSV